jgi:methanesulfonate monooxygenase subunit beta
MQVAKNGADLAPSVRDLIYRSVVLLDGQQVTEWLEALCTPDFEYLITAYSHEIRREQEWFHGRRDELLDVVKMMPYHNTDHSPFTRHVSVYTVDIDESGKTAEAVSSLVVYQNMFDSINSHLDSGETRLFCSGKYYDRVSLEGGQPRLQQRNVRLDTRRLDKGSHFLL